MPYYAQIDADGVVLQVVAIAEVDTLNSDYEEDETIGSAYACRVVGEGRWIRTSYNGSIRKQYAGPGYTYNEQADVFVAPQPFESWVLNDEFDWVSPIPYPDNGQNYEWDETSKTWALVHSMPVIPVVTLE